MKKKICVITSSRSDYGLLKPFLEKANTHEKVELQLIVTGSHLSSEFGHTYKEIDNIYKDIDNTYIKKLTCKIA